MSQSVRSRRAAIAHNLLSLSGLVVALTVSPVFAGRLGGARSGPESGDVKPSPVSMV